MRAAAAEVDEMGELGLWQPAWFPVLHLHPDEVLVVDCADDDGELWLVRCEADEIRRFVRDADLPRVNRLVAAGSLPRTWEEAMILAYAAVDSKHECPPGQRVSCR